MAKVTTVVMNMDVHALLHAARLDLSQELGDMVSFGQTIHSLLVGRENWIRLHRQQMEDAEQTRLRAKIKKAMED